jgi:hypothetical protein
MQERCIKKKIKNKKRPLMRTLIYMGAMHGHPAYFTGWPCPIQYPGLTNDDHSRDV